MKLRNSVGRVHRAQGFTLIELVMVIVIIGILSAVALPRFFDLGSSARIAAVQGLLGSVNSAMAITHSAALVSTSATNNASAAPGATNTQTVEGQTVLMGYGYPTSAAGGIDKAINFQAGSAWTTTPGASSYVWAQSGGSSAANCSVTYTPASAATVPATVTSVTTGC